MLLRFPVWLKHTVCLKIQFRENFVYGRVHEIKEKQQELRLYFLMVKLGLTLWVELGGTLTLLSKSNHPHHPCTEAWASLLVIIVIIVSPQWANLTTDTWRLGERSGSCRHPAGGRTTTIISEGKGPKHKRQGTNTSQSHREEKEMGSEAAVAMTTDSNRRSSVNFLLWRLRLLLPFFHWVALLQCIPAFWCPHYFLCSLRAHPQLCWLALQTFNQTVAANMRREE